MRRRKPSLTAYGIARAVDYVAADGVLAALLPAESGKITMRLMHGAFRRFHLDHWLLRRRWIKPLARMQERLFMPGILAHVALRKRWIDDVTCQLLGTAPPTPPVGLETAADLSGSSEGLQVLVLGAGFDTLCARLAPRHPDVTFIEVDHPPTQARKRRGLERAALLNDNFHLLGADLQDAGWPHVLRDQRAWRGGRTTVVIAEGLTMYLSPLAVERIFALLRDGTGPGSCLIFTFMEPRREGRLVLGHMEWLTHVQLRMVGEPFGWGIRREDLPGYLAEHDLRLRARPGQDLLRAAYLAPLGLQDAPLAGFEHLAVTTCG